MENQKLILGVDDDIEITTILQRWLTMEKHRACFFNDIREFFQALGKEKCHLCIVDINIKTLGIGFEVITEIRKKFGDNLPIICLSSLSDMKNIAHAIEIGANDYIIKPTSRAILTQKCQQLLEMSSSSSSSFSSSISLPEGQYRFVPTQFSDIKLSSKVYIEGIDEHGFKVRSNFLIQKGTAIWIRSSLVEEILKKQEIFCTVTSNWVVIGSTDFGAYLEFDLVSSELTDNIRNWIYLKRKSQENER
ncbi:MAG: response regulator [Oligoflexia bacterium]|nr:response regulator [Oligoflexia bacterium]